MVRRWGPGYAGTPVGLVAVVFEVGAVIADIAVLVSDPNVEELVHDENAHAVAQIEEVWIGRIVGGADGVHPVGLELRDPPLHGPRRRSEPEPVVVLMQAHAFHLRVRAIDIQASRGVVHQAPDPERRDVVVKRGAADLYVGQKLYMLGASGDHSLGFVTGTSNAKLADAPAAIFCAAALTGASAVPLASLTMPCRLTLCDDVPELTTEVVTLTVADAVVGAGVLTYVAH